MSVQERLEDLVERVPESGCWIWMAAVDPPPRLAYGKFWLKNEGRSVVAHRVAWMIYRGPIPDGMRVLHRCDVPSCVNPGHLFLGTARDNTRDMMRKHRDETVRASRRGERNNFTKLTPAQVMEIRSAVGNQYDIAEMFGISQACVSLIKRKINWSHL